MAVAAALAISACGGGASGSSSGAGAPARASDAVSVRQVSGVGRVLVDQSGKALYSPDQEANGTILCSGGCTAFWKPVTAAAGKPSPGAGAGKLGVIKRPDGTMQLTDNGRPLYTFADDSPGKATGDGFKDDFSGRRFTWHVVRSGGTTSSGSQPSAPNSSAPSSGGYGGY
jgi:predicted lipoprotein with Yx(FWY)xxD motif